MTQEEKARAYDKAIERAKSLIGDTIIEESGQHIAEVIFPELKEPEDEKVRKALIEMVHDTTGDELWVDYNVHKEEALSWLEKQGKSSDQIHYWTEEEIEPIISDYLRGAEHYGGMIARLRCLKPKSLEKQSETYTKRDVDDAWLKGMCDAKRELEKQAEVVSDKDDVEAEEKGIRKAFNKIWEEKQDKQKSQRMISAEAKEAMYAKIAWSEEDEKMINDAISFISHSAFKTIGKGKKNTISWLKSLKDRVQPQNTWKPSDEQMADLWNMLCECRPADHQLLQDIYYGLKKLRENNL